MALAQFGVIDTHCHLWRRDLADWVTSEMGRLHRDFEPADLAAAGDSVGVEAFVLVEAGDTRPENEWFEQAAGTAPFIAGFVPYVELDRPTLGDELDRWQAGPKFCGVRHRYESHPDPDILKRPAIRDGFAELARRGIVFDFLVRVPHLPDVLDICRALPDLTGVVEHLAKPDMAEGTEESQWRDVMQALARDTNIICKLSLSPRGEDTKSLLTQPPQGWPLEPTRPYVQFMLEHFGPDRLMWGSDWPVALASTSYEGIYQTMRDAIGPLDADDELKIFRTNAIRTYGLKLKP